MSASHTVTCDGCGKSESYDTRNRSAKPYPFTWRRFLVTGRPKSEELGLEKVLLFDACSSKCAAQCVVVLFDRTEVA